MRRSERSRAIFGRVKRSSPSDARRTILNLLPICITINYQSGILFSLSRECIRRIRLRKCDSLCGRRKCGCWKVNFSSECHSSEFENNNRHSNDGFTGMEIHLNPFVNPTRSASLDNVQAVGNRTTHCRIIIHILSHVKRAIKGNHRPTHPRPMSIHSIEAEHQFRILYDGTTLAFLHIQRQRLNIPIR